MKQTGNFETTVGGFLLFGIGVICTLIIFFGEMSGLLGPTYTLTVNFPDASGLLKGSAVYLSGAPIGKVITDPRPIQDMAKAEVKLRIDKDVRLRQDATYTIGSSGLLGDKFVEVRPKQHKFGEEEAPYVKDGDVINGAETPSFDDLMSSAEPLLNRANHIAVQLDNMITRLNTDVLSGTSVDDLRDTITGLKHLSDDGDTLVTNANDLLVQVKTNQGALGRLIYDKRMGENLAAFIANLRVHGPIFYHDDTANTGPGAHAPENETLREKYEGVDP
jgi:phospholipid/cholesterol/gamma-HCH transport system substrate-binding protein